MNVKNIFLLMLLPLLSIATSCKNDVDDVLADLPDTIYVPYGQSRPVINVAEDAVVVPSILTKIYGVSENPKIADFEDGYVVGKFMGTTIVTFYSDEEMTKPIKAVVVEVGPTARRTMVSGTEVMIADIVPDFEYDYRLTWRSKDNSVAATYGTTTKDAVIQAMKPGKTVVYDYNNLIEIEVTPYVGEVPFTLPNVKFEDLKSAVKEAMAGYQIVAETPNTIQYAPYGNCKSITFEFKELSRWQSGGFVRDYYLRWFYIETTAHAQDVLSYLVTNYERDWNTSNYKLPTGTFEIDHSMRLVSRYNSSDGWDGWSYLMFKNGNSDYMY